MYLMAYPSQLGLCVSDVALPSFGNGRPVVRLLLVGESPDTASLP